ncbi:MAG: prepilin peptidase [Bacillota bacterium]
MGSKFVNKPALVKQRINNLINSPQLFIFIILFAIGLCFGSFLNVIVYRLPKKLSLINPPSRCPSCSYRLGWPELLPLFGYLWIKGRCRQCKVKISPRYPLAELATGLLFVFVFAYYSWSLEFIAYLTLLFLLLVISLIDLEHRVVPNQIIAAGFIAGLIFYLPRLADFIIAVPAWLIAERSLADAFFGMLLGSGVMFVIFLVSRGGMGAGDLKLMALIGFFVGLRGTAMVMLLGFMIGALTGIYFMITGRLTRKDALPFAPFLSLATLIEIFWGEEIWEWYTGFLA